MARLIDVDKLIHALANDYIGGKKTLGQIVDEQPTAYDVDKIVNALVRDKFVECETILSDVHQGYNAGLIRAIEIVKGGGSK